MLFRSPTKRHYFVVMILQRIVNGTIEGSQGQPEHGPQTAGRDPEGLGRRRHPFGQVLHHLMHILLLLQLTLDPVGETGGLRGPIIKDGKVQLEGSINLV